MSRIYVRENGLWRAVASPPPIDDPDDPDVPDDPAPASWQEAVDTRDFSEVRAWYAANTGHEALGLTYEDLESGSLESTHDGQVIEGIRGGPIRVAHDNVTIRGCRVENYGLHGAYFSPTHGANIEGLVIENCTYNGDFADVRANFFNPSTTSGASTVRYCNIRGWRSGHSSYNGSTLEYCWIHDLSAPNETHRTGAMIGGSGCHYIRNYITDGGSGCCNMYGDLNPLNNSSMVENILNGSSPNASPSFLINLKTGDQAGAATDIKLTGNMFGPEFQFGTMSGSNIPWGSDGNARTDNQWFLTGELINND